MRVRRLVAYEDNLCVFKGDIGWWTVGSAPALGEPVAVTQGYQGRVGDAAADRQVVTASRGAREGRGARTVVGDLFCCRLDYSDAAGGSVSAIGSPDTYLVVFPGFRLCAV